MKFKIILIVFLVSFFNTSIFAGGKKYCVGVNRPTSFKSAAKSGSEENIYCNNFFREQQKLSQQIQIERLKGTLAKLKRKNAKRGLTYNLSRKKLYKLIKIEQEKYVFLIKLKRIKGIK